MNKLKQIFFYPSSLSLILVNIIPLWGVIWREWDIFSIMILYWLESAVVGFFNILKMEKINSYKFTPLVPFFIVHYAIFMFVHLFFILKFFQANLGQVTEYLEAAKIVFKYLESLFVSTAFLFLSHGLSFMFNFIRKREFINFSLRQQMILPYKRIIIMHLVIILVAIGFVYNDYNQTLSAVVFLVVLKTIFDLSAHIFEHRKNIFS